MSDPVEIAGVAFGFAYVVLAIRQNVWCWGAGLMSAALYIAVFLQARLYGAMGLQALYVLLMLYGWREWLQGGDSGAGLRVSRTPRAWALALGVATLVGGAGFGVFLRQTDAALPFWDAGATAVSLTAQFMTTRKWLENWHLWTCVNAVYVGIYASQDLKLTAGLYAAFMILAVLGLREWKRALPSPA